MALMAADPCARDFRPYGACGGFMNRRTADRSESCCAPIAAVSATIALWYVREQANNLAALTKSAHPGALSPRRTWFGPSFEKDKLIE
jgi:hypothetical protein